MTDRRFNRNTPKIHSHWNLRYMLRDIIALLHSYFLWWATYILTGTFCRRFTWSVMISTEVLNIDWHQRYSVWSMQLHNFWNNIKYGIHFSCGKLGLFLLWKQNSYILIASFFYSLHMSNLIESVLSHLGILRWTAKLYVHSEQVNWIIQFLFAICSILETESNCFVHSTITYLTKTVNPKKKQKTKL